MATVVGYGTFSSAYHPGLLSEAEQDAQSGTLHYNTAINLNLT